MQDRTASGTFLSARFFPFGVGWIEPDPAKSELVTSRRFRADELASAATSKADALSSEDLPPKLLPDPAS